MTAEDVRRIALSLPEASEEPHFQYTSFRIRRKIFATMPPDGGHLHVFVADGEREPALAMHPGFIEKLFWGAKVCGLRIRLRRAPAPIVANLLKQAWLLKAPKRLAQALHPSPIDLR